MNDYNLKNVVTYFKQEVGNAIRTNDSQTIERIMLNTNYSLLNKEQKEFHILDSALSFYAGASGIKVVEKFFHYIVFEYKIDEEVYNKKLEKYENKALEAMFEIRRMNEDMNKELKVNDTQIKKIKI
jgi:hypothetical protein